MRVVFIQRKKPPFFFSIERYFDNVRKHLPADVEAIVSEASCDSNGFMNRFKIMLEARRRQADVNHITGDIHFAALLLEKRKTILTVHDIGLIHHPSAIARFILGMFWVKWPVQRSAIVTAVSQATKNEIVRYTGCDPNKVHVIPTCIGPHFRRVEKPFNKQKPVVLQIGTVANKNCIRMARALEGINCRLEIIGQPDEAYLEVLHECKIDYGVSSKLIDEQVLDKYINCDILLFASTLEGFGMPIVEANTVGRVVVTSNLSSMPDVAGGAACLVDPYDVQSIRNGVMKVIEDDAYRDELIEKGYTNARRFQLSEVARNYYELYRQIAAGR